MLRSEGSVVRAQSGSQEPAFAWLWRPRDIRRSPFWESRSVGWRKPGRSRMSPCSTREPGGQWTITTQEADGFSEGRHVATRLELRGELPTTRLVESRYPERTTGRTLE